MQLPENAIDRRTFCASVAAGAATVGLARFASAEPSSRRTNIVLIVAEDMGQQAGCYGDTTVPTPQLDRLAGEGVLFENGYVTQASCSPSRSSIFTGLYPHENGQLGLSHRGYTMHRGIPTLPALLKAEGYRTGVIGKVHVAPDEDIPFDFTAQEYLRLSASAGRPLRPDTRDVRLYAEMARAFIEGSGEEPFFLMANFGDAHKVGSRYPTQVKGLPEHPVGPDDVPLFPEFGEIDTPEIREEVAGYYNAVQRVDAGVGLLVDVLSETKHENETLVVFIGDHGPPVSRGKTTTYEFGLKIPFIVRWPGRMRAGSRLRELVSTVDILPTCVEAAGGQVPREVTGQSLSPLLSGQTEGWRQTLCAEWTTHGPGFTPQRCIRDARHKLILNLRVDVPKPGLGVDGSKVRDALRDPKWEGTEARRVFDLLENPPPVELYDLRRDPIEYHNLAGDPEYAAVAKRLGDALQAWREATHDPLLDPEYFEAMVAHHDAFDREYRAKVAAAKKAGEKPPRRAIDMTGFQRDWPLR